jgi:tetratricopeptide (TPR) repeat protein
MAVFPNAHTTWLRLGLLVLLALAGLPSRGGAADTNAAPSAVIDESWRAALQLQEQLRQTQSAIEKNRLTAEAQAASNTSAFAERLDQLERSLAARRATDVAIEQSENHTILLAMSVFAGIALLILVVASYFQWSTVNRLAAAAAGLTVLRPVPMLTMEEGTSQPSQLLAQSGARFMEVIERLERRILQFEASGKTSRPLPEHAPANGTAAGGPARPPAPAKADTTTRNTAEEVSLLVGKSQTLLKMNKSEEALAALEEALSIDPDNGDALLKKGTALERLERVDEAILCFDRAIALDPSTTMAYLYKGALYNRMHRYPESLACYEQALKANAKTHPAPLSV